MGKRNSAHAPPAKSDGWKPLKSWDVYHRFQLVIRISQPSCLTSWKTRSISWVQIKFSRQRCQLATGKKRSLTSIYQKDHFHPFSTWRSLIFVDFRRFPLFKTWSFHFAHCSNPPLLLRSLCGTTGSSNSFRKPMTRRWPSVAAATEAPGLLGPWHGHGGWSGW